MASFAVPMSTKVDNRPSKDRHFQCWVTKAAMTQAQAVETIIAILEHAQARTAMFMHDADRVDVVKGFISGFNVAWRIMGYSISQEVYDAVITQRGWKRSGSRAELLSQKTNKNMKDSGMSDAEVIQELFAIEIDCWKITRGELQPEQKR